jgi:hypothetical protein
MEATKKTKTKTAIPLLGIYLKECKSGYNKDICTLIICRIIHNS